MSEDKAPAPTSSGRLVFDSALFFAGRIIGAGAAFASHWVVARWLGAQGLGYYSTALAATFLLSTIATLGLPRAAVRFLPEYRGLNKPDMVRGYVRAALLSGAAFGALITGAGLLVTSALRQPGSDPGIDAMSVALLCVVPLVLLNQLTGIAQGMYWRYHAAFPKDAIRPVLFLGALVGAWWVVPSITPAQAMWLQFGVLAAVMPAMMWLMLKSLNAWYLEAPARTRYLQWLRVGVPMVVMNLSLNFFPEVNVAIVGTLLPAAQVGVFFIAFRIAFLLGFALLAIDQATLANVSKSIALGQRALAQTSLRRAGYFKIFVVVILFGFLWIAGPHLLAAFAGPQDRPAYVEGHGALMWLAAILVARAILGPVAELLSLTGQHNQAAAAGLITIMVTVIADVWVVPTYGLLGAAIVAFSASVGTSVLMLALLVKKTGINPCLLFPAVQSNRLG